MSERHIEHRTSGNAVFHCRPNRAGPRTIEECQSHRKGGQDRDGCTSEDRQEAILLAGNAPAAEGAPQAARMVTGHRPVGR